MGKKGQKRRESAHGTGIPRGAVAADRTQQVVPNSSYDLPPTYYVDIQFKCRDCGKREVWTAKQQKWYYEVAKGPLYATAIRCHDCRARIRAEKELQRQQMEKSEKAGRGEPPGET